MNKPALVHDISSLDLTDVPRRLRALADELERGGDPIRACAVVIDFTHLPLEIVSYGSHGDQMRTIGLLALAQAYLTDSLIAWGLQDGGRPVGPAA